jgi:hypothetical protein
MTPNWLGEFRFLTRLGMFMGSAGLALAVYTHERILAALGALVFAVVLFIFLGEIIYQLAIISDWKARP